MRRNQRLLILCSYFSAEALRRGSSASEECGRVLEQRERAAERAHDALGGSLRAMEAFQRVGLARLHHEVLGERDLAEALKPASDQEGQLKEALARVEETRAAARAQDPASLAQGLVAKGLQGPEAWKRILRRGLRELDLEAGQVQGEGKGKGRAKRLEPEELLEGAALCLEEVKRRLAEVLAAAGRLAFLQRTLSLVAI